MAERDTFAWRIENWGYGRTLHWALMRLMNRLTGLRIHYVLVTMNPDEREPTPMPDGYTARIISIADLRPHAVDNEELDAEFLDLAEERGDVCFANFCGDELVGFSFETLERARATMQLDVLIPQGFSYGYKGWTHPDHRLKGLNLIRGDVSRERSNRPPSVFYIETTNYASLLRRYRSPSQSPTASGLLRLVFPVRQRDPLYHAQSALDWAGARAHGRDAEAPLHRGLNIIRGRGRGNCSAGWQVSSGGSAVDVDLVVAQPGRVVARRAIEALWRGPTLCDSQEVCGQLARGPLG